MAETVLYEAEGGVAKLTLNRPEVLNAFNLEEVEALHATLRRAIDERQRCVVITGAGRGFCAGQDLRFTSGGGLAGVPDTQTLLEKYYYPSLRLIRSMDAPVIAAVNGVAAGGGFALAMMCDLRIAADSARFVAAFGRIALAPDLGLAWTLPRLVGAGRARRILLHSQQVSAAEALEIGMVDRVVPAECVLEEAMVSARALAQGPTKTLGLTKRLLDDGMTLDFERFLTAEANAQAAAGASDDAREAIAAFLRKEEPRFRGS